MNRSTFLEVSKRRLRGALHFLSLQVRDGEMQGAGQSRERGLAAGESTGGWRYFETGIVDCEI